MPDYALITGNAMKLKPFNAKAMAKLKIDLAKLESDSYPIMKNLLNAGVVRRMLISL